jgi:hypothetical protein
MSERTTINIEPSQYQAALPGGVRVSITSNGVEGEGIHIAHREAIAAAMAIYVAAGAPGARIVARLLEAVSR